MVRAAALTLIALAALAAADAPPAAWRPVDALMRARLAAAGAPPGMGMAVYDAADHPVFQAMYGDFAGDRMVAIASASKLVAGLAILDLVAASPGRLSLDSTTGAVLGWTGPQAAITLRHLLSFTSGLAPEAAATADPRLSLAACVAAIAAAPPDAEPGVRFAYGSTHLQVAARMAEVVAGKPWDALLRERITAPLGLPAEVTCYTWPKQAIGTSNPLIAGGMRASLATYAPILAAVFHRGVVAGHTFANEALFAEQAREPFAVVVAKSPALQLGLASHYGLTAWLEGETPRTGSDVLSSAGAFGFVPWLDRRTGYYAILAMEMPGGARFATPLEQALQPLIRTALASVPTPGAQVVGAAGR